jgi:hypothetical protein
MITYKELWYNQCLDFCHGTINYSPYMVVINKSNFNDIHVQHVYNDMTIWFLRFYQQIRLLTGDN